MQNQKEVMVTRENSKAMMLAKMGMLVAISLLLVNIHFPIFAPVPFLEYDPADIPILIGGFAFGPIAGLVLTVVTSVIQGLTVSAQSGIYGIIMHIIATGTLVLVSSIIYKVSKTKKFAAIGLILGSISMTLIMVGANYIVTPLFMGVPRAAITSIIWFIVGFNIIKAGVNSLITFVLYKRVSNLLNKGSV